jgi:hypothetical protein
MEEQEGRVSWMWADAGLLGLRMFANMNPLRWSSGTVVEVATQLQAHEDKGTTRPVKLRISGNAEHVFVDPAAARAWLQGLSAHDEDHVVPTGSIAVSFAMKVLSVPGLAVFLRTTSGDEKRTWSQRNIFAAYSYATQVVNHPHAVRAKQLESGECSERRSTWKQFFESPDSHLVAFVNAAQCLVDRRPAVVVASGGEEWTRDDSDDCANDFWAVYNCGTRSVIAIRGGDADGRPGDMKRHSGSPIRAFAQGDDCERVPSELLPLACVKRLIGAGREVTLVAFSQGSIAGMATAFSCPSLARAVLFNSASMFWPPWLTVPEKSACCANIVSYAVDGDPLSDGVWNSHGAPRVCWADNVLLPTRAKGFDNHHLHWFERREEAQCEPPPDVSYEQYGLTSSRTDGLMLSQSGE